MENILGKRIKNLREEGELSQLELAKLLNINNSTLSQYEAGNRIPSDDIKIKIAKYFNVSLDYLVGNSDIKNPYDNKEPINLDEVEVWFHKTDGYKDLPEEARKELSDYISYLRHKYGKKE